MKAFWIVVDSERGPSCWPFRHPTEVAAVAEAERLCRLNGGVFFVMEAKHVVKKQEIITEALVRETNDGIPF